MINQNDLQYFIELANTLHLTRASERIGITQPALSHCLKRLESEIGQPLFIRSKKGLTLTSAGQSLMQKAKLLIEQWDKLKLNVSDDTEKPQGVIRLGCHTAVAQYAVSPWLGSFLKNYPDIEVSLKHGLSRYMTEKVISSNLDVALVVNPVSHADLIIKELAKDQVCLWKSKKCKNEDILIIEPSLLQTQSILQKLKKNNLRFKRVIESGSLEVIASLTAQGVGYGLLPERVLKSYDANFFEIPVGSPKVIDKICLVYKHEFRKLKRGQVFLETVVGSF